MGEGSKLEELKAELSQFLECGICFLTMTLPYRIPCGHVFCANCLYRINPTRCPYCRVPYAAKDFVEDHLMKELADAVGSVNNFRKFPPTPENVKAEKDSASQLLEFESSDSPQFPYQPMQKFAQRFFKRGELEEIIVNTLGTGIEEIKLLKKVGPDSFEKCDKRPNCNSPRCLHTTPWNMCKNGEMCRRRSYCFAFHPVELLNLCFNVKKDGL